MNSLTSGNDQIPATISLVEFLELKSKVCDLQSENDALKAQVSELQEQAKKFKSKLNESNIPFDEGWEPLDETVGY